MASDPLLELVMAADDLVATWDVARLSHGKLAQDPIRTRLIEAVHVWRAIRDTVLLEADENGTAVIPKEAVDKPLRLVVTRTNERG
jgi:hypothetical protein